MKLEIVFKDGRKETFDGVVSFNVTEEQITKKECHASDLAQTPSEGKLFQVNPLGIEAFVCTAHAWRRNDFGGRNGHGRLFRKHLRKLTSILKNMLLRSTP